MKARPLLSPAIAALLLLLTMQVFMAAWSRRLPYSQKLNDIRDAQNPNVLFVGNSLLDGRVDAPAMEEASTPRLPIVPLDSALGATEPPEHLLLYEYSTRCHPHMRLLVLGIYDFQLTAQKRPRVRELTGNRVLAVDHRFPVTEVAAAYGFDLWEDVQLEAMRVLPIVAYRSNAWRYAELLRRKMESMGMPQAATNSMGRVTDFAALEPTSVSSFDSQAHVFLAQPKLNASYETMFTEAENAGMKIVVVVMPMSPSHREIFYSRPLWAQYLEGVRVLAEERGIRVIDASNWMASDEDFVDHLHMSMAAAHIFSIRLGNQITTEF
jgi:hypothetical protein